MANPPWLVLWLLWSRSPASERELAVVRTLEAELAGVRVALRWFASPSELLRDARNLGAGERPDGVLVWDSWTSPLPWVARGGLGVLGVSSDGPRSTIWFCSTPPPPDLRPPPRVLRGEDLVKRISYQLRRNALSKASGRARGAQRAADPPGIG